MNFTKMHGLGNDFIIIEDMGAGLDFTAEAAARLCDRRTGIGGDGVMLVRPSHRADAYMHLFNSDGSVAEMCGNGIRCFAKYVYEKGIAKKPVLSIDTPAGVKLAELTLEGEKVTAVRIDMGMPLFEKKDVPMVGDGICCRETVAAGGREFLCSALNTGVPHLVVFEEGLSEEEICHYGPLLEKHPLFPAKINVNFARIQPDGSIAVRTWERGCGRTLACGTGSCACVAAAAMAGYCPRETTVRLALGELFVEWAQNGHIFMTGPAEVSFCGRI
ncbi:MAG: diaminopimelate epimerase [Clostridia bacterium]|nr:diaminopimelate epimerase [Clostridia bacterium]